MSESVFPSVEAAWRHTADLMWLVMWLLHRSAAGFRDSAQNCPHFDMKTYFLLISVNKLNSNNKTWKLLKILVISSVVETHETLEKWKVSQTASGSAGDLQSGVWRPLQAPCSLKGRGVSLIKSIHPETCLWFQLQTKWIMRSSPTKTHFILFVHLITELCIPFYSDQCDEKINFNHFIKLRLNFLIKETTLKADLWTSSAAFWLQVHRWS